MDWNGLIMDGRGTDSKGRVSGKCAKCCVLEIPFQLILILMPNSFQRGVDMKTNYKIKVWIRKMCCQVTWPLL